MRFVYGDEAHSDRLVHSFQQRNPTAGGVFGSHVTNAVLAVDDAVRHFAHIRLRRTEETSRDICRLMRKVKRDDDHTNPHDAGIA